MNARHPGTVPNLSVSEQRLGFLHTNGADERITVARLAKDQQTHFAHVAEFEG